MSGGLEAGPALDAEIARRVFGYTGVGYYGPPPEGPWEHAKSVRFDTKAEALAASQARYPDWKERDVTHCHWEEGWGPLYVPEYSTEIDSAWQVVEHLQADGWLLHLGMTVNPHAPWWAGWSRCGPGPHEMGAPCDQEATATAMTAPLAICRAALAALGATGDG